jgi:hypothetical protein
MRLFMMSVSGWANRREQQNRTESGLDQAAEGHRRLYEVQQKVKSEMKEDKEVSPNERRPEQRDKGVCRTTDQYSEHAIHMKTLTRMI